MAGDIAPSLFCEGAMFSFQHKKLYKIVVGCLQKIVNNPQLFYLIT